MGKGFAGNVCGDALSIVLQRMAGREMMIKKTSLSGMLAVLARKTLGDALQMVINRKVFDELLDGNEFIEEINDPSGVCVEKASSLSDWLTLLATGAANLWHKKGKVTTEDVIREVTKEFLPRICGVVNNVYLKRAILTILKRYIIEGAEREGVSTTYFIRTHLDSPLPPYVVDEVKAIFKAMTPEINKTVVTTLNIVLWLHLNPGRALLLASYFKDVEGRVWALDILAETIGFYIWKYLGVCPPKEGLPLVILGRSEKKATDLARTDYLFTPDFEELSKFIASYYEMNFPCAPKSKKSEGIMKLAKEMITPRMGPIAPIIEDEHKVIIERYRKPYVVPETLRFARPICGVMPSYIARLKTKSKDKVLNLVGVKELKKAIESIPAERIYYAMAYKSYRKPTAKEIAEVKKRVANADVSGLRPTQAESLKELLETIALYNGGILKARTGWGKTVVASKLIENAIKHGKKLFGRKIKKIFFVTKAALVEQAAKEIEARCPECMNYVEVVSYDALYSAIRHMEEVTGARLTIGDIKAAISEKAPFIRSVIEREGFRGLLRRGIPPIVYDAIASGIAELSVPFRYQFSIRVMSDEWVRALAYGEAIEEIEEKGVVTTKPKTELVREFMNADMVIFDEVHELRQLSKLKLLEVNRKAIRVGLSATPQHLYSAENVELLKTAIGPIVIGKEEEELEITGAREVVEEAELPEDTRHAVPKREIIVKKFSAPGTNTKSVSEYWSALLKAIASNKEVLDTLRDPSKKVLILTRYVKGHEKFIEGLRKLGVDALFVDDDTMPIEEAKKYADVTCLRRYGIRSVDKKAVAKCMKSGVYVATEAKLGTGWNDPELDVLVLANSMLKHHRNVYRLIQVIGRSMRFAPGKDKKLILLACPVGKNASKYFTCDEELVKETIEKELESYRL